MWFLEFLENNGFATWVRESQSIFAYPTTLAFHTFGMGFLVGTSAGIALRTLGFAPGLPVAPLEKFFRVMWISFWISAVSGVLLLIIDVRTFLVMPAFYIKLLGIAVALMSIRLLRSRVFGDSANLDTRPVPMDERSECKPDRAQPSIKAKILAGATLTSWAVAITAGRVTAYGGFIGWQTAAAVLILAAVMLVAGSIAFRFWGSKKSARQARVATSAD